MKLHSILLAAIFIVASLPSGAQAPSIAIQPFAGGFSSPVDIRHCGDSRIFVVEQDGYIRIITDSGNVLPTPFLNIDPIVSSGGERGLLGLAFHPDYKSNGYFYVYYTNSAGSLRISRFNVSAADSNLADAASEFNILTIPHPGASNHNGGCLRFGPDGYLYLGTGDGGGGGDPDNNAQFKKKLLGKMIRIDVDGASPYAIPPDNPYANDTAYYPEIFAMGMRNPWRFSFDKMNGDLWIGDVGQGAWEEIDYVKGAVPDQYNFGWRCYEGNHPYNTDSCLSQSSYDAALYEHAHNAGGYCSVVGGYVYRGGKYGDMFGCYFYGDYCNDTIHVLRETSPGTFTHYGLIPFSAALSAFGEDNEGNLYVANLNNGDVRKIVSTVCKPVAYVADSDTLNVCADSVLLSSPFDASTIYSWNSPSGTSGGNQLWVSQSGWVKLTAINLSACINQDSAYVNILGVPQAPVITGINALYCSNGDPDTLSANPAGGTFTGAGINGNVFSPSSVGAGNYAVTYTYLANGVCEASTSLQATVADPQAGSITGIDSIYCTNGNSDTLTGIPAGGVFSGAINGNVFDPASAGQGQYTIVYQFTDSNQCASSVSAQLTVDVCSGITENANTGIQIFSAVTFNDRLNIMLDSGISDKLTIEVSDMSGRRMLIYNTTVLKGEQQFSIPFNGENGIYFIAVHSSRGTVGMRVVSMH